MRIGEHCEGEKIVGWIGLCAWYLVITERGSKLDDLPTGYGHLGLYRALERWVMATVCSHLLQGPRTGFFLQTVHCSHPTLLRSANLRSVSSKKFLSDIELACSVELLLDHKDGRTSQTVAFKISLLQPSFSDVITPDLSVY